MDNDEQLQSENQQFQSESEPMPGPDEYDYNREPPLDSATTSANRGRSKYVFMTLCFLLALILFYTYINGTSVGDTSNWFPLIGAIVLAVLGVIFLRSPDGPPEESEQSVFAPPPAPTEIIMTGEALSPFEELVQEALSTIPGEFRERMENVVVRVVYAPDQETLTRTGVNEGHILLGLYEGVPLTTYGRNSGSYPEVITIYQCTIEDYCLRDPMRIREQVRKTVLHEVAHHFGMGHEEMPIWVK